MKLTNKQLDIVKDMIREKVKTSVEAEQQKKEKEIKAKAIKLCEKHPAFIAFCKAKDLLPIKYFYEVAIKDSVFYQIAKWEDSTCYSSCHTHIKSKEDFYDAVIRRMPDHWDNRYNNNTEFNTKKEIERKLILASVNVKDLEQLIVTVSKEFVK